MPYIIILAVLIIFLGIPFGIGNYFYNLALNVHTKGKTAQNPEQEGLLPFEMDHSWIETTSHEHVYMQTFDDLVLHGLSVVNEPKKWVILQHGYKSEGLNMSYCAERFYKLGFSILLVDARGHGTSQGDYRGMAWHDRLDIKCWIDFLNSHHQIDSIVLYGISMGAATVMMTGGEKLPTNVRAIIEDCGYSSIKKEMTYNLKTTYNLPGFPILNMASMVCKLRAGFSLTRDGSAVKQLNNCKLPVLFIHGDGDTFVPFHMMEEVYQASQGPKEKLVIKGAKHGMACFDDPTKYWDTVKDFCNKYC